MAHSHIISAFDEELKYLQRRISEMGGMAEEMVSQSVVALVNTDTELAEKVIAEDLALDEAEREVGEKAIVTIARRQPVAADCRHRLCVRHPTTGRLMWATRLPFGYSRSPEHFCEVTQEMADEFHRRHPLDDNLSAK